MSKLVPCYRYLGHGEHFYTASKEEGDNAVASFGYTYEGIAWYVYDGPEATTDPATALWSEVVDARAALIAAKANHAATRVQLKAAQEAYDTAMSRLILAMKI